MHDDKKGFNYDAMRHHHGPEDSYDYPSHGHRHPAYDFPDVYHPVPYGKEYLGNQPIHLQDPHSGHVVHPCPPRDWGRHGCEHEHEHHHEIHVPPMHDYLSEYVGLLEDYFHKDKGLDDCDCGEAIRHLRDEINRLLKALGRDVEELDKNYDSVKSKLAYYIGKTQACIQSTEEYMRRQELIGSDWEEMKEVYGRLIEEWEEFGATVVLRYAIDTKGAITEVPDVKDMLEGLASEMPVITDVVFPHETDVDFVDEIQLDEFAKIVFKYNGKTDGSYGEFTTFLKDNTVGPDNVHGNYYVIYDRVELIVECLDRKVTDHPENWKRSAGYPKYTVLKDFSQGTTVGAVTTSMLADDAVTSEKIKDGEVKAADLADGAVTSTKIANKAVTTGKLDDKAVETDKIGVGAVTEAKLADNAVTTNKIKDKSVTKAKLADDVVFSNNIADGEVKTNDLADGAVATAKLANSAVTNAKINNGAVSEEKLSSAVQTKLNKDDDTKYSISKNGKTVTLTGTDGSTSSFEDTDTVFELTDGIVTTAKLANGAVTENKIGNGEVTEVKLSTAVQNKLNKDDNTTYSLDGDGSTITLTGSDGKKTTATKPNRAIILGDAYDMNNGGWSSKLINYLGLSGRVNVAHANGAGFSGNNNQTFLGLLQGVASSLTVAQKNMVSHIIVGGGNDDRGKADNVVEEAMQSFGSYVRTNFPNATVIVGLTCWRNDDDATPAQGTWGYLTAASKYIDGCGRGGLRFIGNSPYVLHDYRLLDSSGWLANADGCSEIAKMFAIEYNGGTYSKIGKRVQLSYSIPSDMYVGKTAQNHLFPDENNTEDPSIWCYINNNMVSFYLLYVHTLEFRTPKNLIAHVPNYEGYTGQFKILNLDAKTGYMRPAYNFPIKYIPCSVIDSSGNVINATLGVTLRTDGIYGWLYKVNETNGLGFTQIDNVKYIHTPYDWGIFDMPTFDC